MKSFLLGALFALSLTFSVHAQQTNPQPNTSVPAKPNQRDSVTVTAKLSPEEVEEDRLNDPYESIAQLQRNGADCATLIPRYQAEVIPLAENSKFNVPKNKFLFLANREIGNCYLSQKKFAEAEASFEKIMQYAPVWPGTNDSAYPINFRQIATAQMGQQRWNDAEQSLLKSISLFDPQIAAGEKVDAESHSQFTSNYRGSQSRSIALLAVVYFREGRVPDALKTIEKAYDEVDKYKLAPQFYNSVIKIGRDIADASQDSAAQRTWASRNPIQ
jgi:tetratricopeptide (TPR) repeat protein